MASLGDTTATVTLDDLAQAKLDMMLAEIRSIRSVLADNSDTIRAVDLARRYITNECGIDVSSFSATDTIAKLIEICDEETDNLAVAAKERDRWQSRYFDLARSSGLIQTISGDSSVSLGL